MRSKRSEVWTVLLGAMALVWGLTLSVNLNAPTGADAWRSSVTAPPGAMIAAAQVALPSTPKKAARETPKPRQGLSSLPVAAQPVVSATLGQDDARYQVGAVGGALRAQNPAQALQAEFTRRGVEVRSGQTHWRLELGGYGYGERLEKAEGAAPQSRANRVEYRRGPLVEWYVNGPAGLEQGFTLTAPPAGAHSGTRDTGYGTRNSTPLTIALEMGGDLTATADSPAERGGRVEGLTLRDGRGQAVLRYTGLTAHDASGRALPAWIELGREELRLRVEDSGARYPVVVDPFFAQQAKLTASDGAFDAYLGGSVAFSSDGSTIVAGAQGATIGSNTAQGAAYVFVMPGNGWATTSSFTAKLTASDGAKYDFLGFSVAVSSDGSTIVAGAPYAAINGQTEQGAAYVFAEPEGGWVTTSSFTAKLTASDGAQGDELGWSVGVSSGGGTIVAGAQGATINGNTEQGAAYVFAEPEGGWATTSNFTAKLTASDGAAYVWFGSSVAVSNDGSTIVAGAPYATIGSNTSQGAAYVFVEPGGTWATMTQTSKLTASDGAESDCLGFSVGVSSDGSTIVTGAPNATIGTIPLQMQGAAYVFVEPATGGWASTSPIASTAKLTASDGISSDAFGYSVGVSSDGSTIVAGAVQWVSLGPGAAYVFVMPVGGWVNATQPQNETAKLTALDGVVGDEFGFSVGASGNGSTIAACAPHATINGNAAQGEAYVFVQVPVTSASLSTTSLSFGGQAVGAMSNPQTVSLTNTGNAPLYVMRLAATSPYWTTSNCLAASPMAVGDSCTEDVAFDPAWTGLISGTLSFIDNTTASPQSVALSGTGQGFTLAAASGSPTSVTVAPGSPASYTLSATGLGGLNLSVSFTCTGAPSEATCTVSPNPATLGSSAINVTVSVTTTAPSLSAPPSGPLPPAPPLSPGVRGLWMLAWALAAMAWAIRRRNQPGVGRWRSTMLALAAGLLLALALAACSGGGTTASNPGTPAGTYTLTVTGTAASGSATLSHSVGLLLTVS